VYRYILGRWYCTTSWGRGGVARLLLIVLLSSSLSILFRVSVTQKSIAVCPLKIFPHTTYSLNTNSFASKLHSWLRKKKKKKRKPQNPNQWRVHSGLSSRDLIYSIVHSVTYMSSFKPSIILTKTFSVPYYFLHETSFSNPYSVHLTIAGGYQYFYSHPCPVFVFHLPIAMYTCFQSTAVRLYYCSFRSTALFIYVRFKMLLAVLERCVCSPGGQTWLK